MVASQTVLRLAFASLVAGVASTFAGSSVAQSAAIERTALSIASVRAMPGYHLLYARRLNVVRVVPTLAFRVTIRNRDSVQHDVNLRLSVTRGPLGGPLVSNIGLGTVRSQQMRTVTVRLPSDRLAFAQKNWLRVQATSSSSRALAARGFGVIFALG
jgi:hypothetical protein